MSTKVCVRCGTEREVAAFPANRRMRDGLDSWCKPCRAVYAREAAWRRKGLSPPGELLRKPSQVVRHADGSLAAKVCPDCAELLPATSFSRNRTSSTGHATYCKPCQKAREDAVRHQRTYGISVAEAAAMRASQESICALCRTSAAEHLDHDHDSGRLRAWLCQRCNMGLGLFDDSAERLRQAADYLDSHDPVVRRELARVRRRARSVLSRPRRDGAGWAHAGAALRREVAPGLWRVIPLAEVIDAPG